MEDECALDAVRSFLDDEDCWVLWSFGMLGLVMSWIKIGVLVSWALSIALWSCRMVACLLSFFVFLFCGGCLAAFLSLAFSPCSFWCRRGCWSYCSTPVFGSEASTHL
jgi:hypothetical protein